MQVNTNKSYHYRNIFDIKSLIMGKFSLQFSAIDLYSILDGIEQQLLLNLQKKLFRLIIHKRNVF